MKECLFVLDIPAKKKKKRKKKPFIKPTSLLKKKIFIMPKLFTLEKLANVTVSVIAILHCHCQCKVIAISLCLYELKSLEGRNCFPLVNNYGMS